MSANVSISSDPPPPLSANVSIVLDPLPPCHADIIYDSSLSEKYVFKWKQTQFETGEIQFKIQIGDRRLVSRLKVLNF